MKITKYILMLLMTPIVYAVDNVPGWDTLLNGSIVGGVMTMYDSTFLGWLPVFIFFLFEFMLMLKTKSNVLFFITTSMFSYLTLRYTELVPSGVEWIITSMAVLSLAGIMYKVFIRRNA